ncbi:helix-turn-helix transcriptional regulator [Agrilactobacillus yilanensis]|uniref:Helix-turn-helix transcriptional regulator n=1 Tax=Agrilactobacillus yilanensis TaxID=2485997 RepID=A0ABW4J2Z3_9LACO|nr:helix-turn-helix transcriptional regulator [Agrilactobacillus yilanensis]
MASIFNFSYLKIDAILTVNEQTYTIGTSHEYQKPQTYLLLYVQTGQILLNAKVSYILNPNELIILPTDEPITFTSAVPDTSALHIIFQSNTVPLNRLCNRTFFIENQDELVNIKNEYKKITILRRRKPEITYDKEIGEFFMISCTKLYTSITQLLLTLGELELKTRLPRTVNIKSDKPDIIPDKAIITHQLESAKTASNSIYKNLLVNQIIAYMKINLNKKLTIESISKEFLIGSSNLKKIFKQETGASIISYFRTLKMKTAQSWVQEHKLPYTDISNKLGFSSVHHFSSAFKTYTGLSPTQYYHSVHFDK